jgi:D-beta-D-heptose 7-phosphate kinase/D-beta-D-heptose 1-phosphate adenosyltransferase
MKILVLGDVMIDVNNYCEINRMCPEKEIPLYNIKKTDYILGGSANVANNLHNLGCDIELISVIGNDYYGTVLQNLLTDTNKIKNKLFIKEERKTTVKNRTFLKNELLSRADTEITDDIDSITETEIINYIYSLQEVNIIVISDYNKGVITENLCKTIIRYSNENNIYTFIDPKLKNISKYKNCFCIKPNLKEGMNITNKKNIYDILNYIKEIIKCNQVVLTADKEGLYVNSITNHITNKKNIKVIDVTGCGDVVISVLVYYFSISKDILKSSKIANYIANKSVETIGNYKVQKEDILNYVDEIITDDEIDKIRKIKNNNKNIVFTNGCFDIVHSAHLKLLQFSKKLGDVLVVGINSDESIKELKGNERPINHIKERCDFLQSLGIIDYIIIFNTSTPYNIIKELEPNVLVKGGDYKKEDIIGGEFANKVILYDYISGLSTTNTIKKILLQNNRNNVNE